MRHFLVTTAHGQSVVRVPKGKSLADVGYADDAVIEAVEVPRAPKDHERFDGKGWKLDPEAAAREDLAVRGRALGRGGLLARIEALEARVAALEGKKER